MAHGINAYDIGMHGNAVYQWQFSMACQSWKFNLHIGSLQIHDSLPCLVQGLCWWPVCDGARSAPAGQRDWHLSCQDGAQTSLHGCKYKKRGQTQQWARPQTGHNMNVGQ